MSKHGIFATLLHHPANTFLLKNLPRWRADTIRPYTVCATEFLPQKFRGVVGEDIIFPVVSLRENNVGAMRRQLHDRTLCGEIRR